MYCWTKHRGKFLIITLCAALIYGVSQGERWFTPLAQPLAYDLNPPKYFGDMVYDVSSNPLTAEGIALGRALFYDPILSLDSTISCASCHSSYTAFSHVDHALSHGIGDTIGKRNAPPIQNVGWHKSFRWDGGLTHLDAQVMA
ncbi:MAG: cytochrome-c peroxidase, partial [Bacteroidota bacterium]|nr:cytochrome-c peroxidase [Bacteroidota bacterium]